MSDHKPIGLTAPCNIQCAAAEEGQPAKNPTVVIDAYNGGVMNVRYYGPVVIDLQGMRVSDGVPILYDHEKYTIDSILGQTSRIERGTTLRASGEIMGESDTTKQVVGLAKRGFQFQASVGATPLRIEEVSAGVVVNVNGQTLTGPYTLVNESVLDEISVVPLGADKTTKSAIAAAHEQGVVTMDPKEKQQDQETIRAAAVAEESRLAGVKAAAKDNDEIRAQAVKDGWSIERTQSAVQAAQLKVAQDELAKIKAERKSEQRPTPPTIAASNRKKADAVVIEAAACLRAGLKSAEKRFDSETLNKASDLRVRSMTDLVRASLESEGRVLDCTRHDTREFLQAAFSSRNIANILSNVANKFIMDGFGAVEESWREVSNVRSVVDFKANTGVRLVVADLLKDLAPNGEIQHGSMSDETRSIQAGTKALMLSVTRQDIINDDLSALTDVPRRLGFAAARTLNTSFWTAFEAAVAANFSAATPKFNQTTGALSLTTLAAAEALFLGLNDADGNPIGAKASKLLCGTTAYTKARELYISTGLVGGSAKDTAQNIYANMFKPVFSSYLSAAPWYLVADPMAIPLMEVAFLNGQQEPIVETADADFNTLGVQMRCYYDYGVAFGEWRSAVRSTGV